MKRHIAILIIFSLVIFSAMTVAQEKKVLKWTGCGITKKAFMDEAARAYQQKTGVRIQVSGGGATKGIRFTNAGTSDMGGCCRPNMPEKYTDEEAGVYLTVVGWDALVPIVSKTNPVENLSAADLKKIMMGEITNWSAVGGPDQPIQVIAREGKISGVGFMARKMIFEDLEADFVATADIVESSGPLEKKVETLQWAIGLTGVSSAKRRNVKILNIDGNEASVAGISSGSYPYFRPLYIATNGMPSGDMKAFLDWLTGTEGQAVVESVGTVTISQGAGLKDKFAHWVHTDRVINFDSLP